MVSKSAAARFISSILAFKETAQRVAYGGVVVSYEDYFVHKSSATQSLTAGRNTTKRVFRMWRDYATLWMRGRYAEVLRALSGDGHCSFRYTNDSELRYTQFGIQPWWRCSGASLPVCGSARSDEVHASPTLQMRSFIDS